MNWVKKNSKVIKYIVIIFALMIAIFPLYWMFITSLKERNKLFTIPPEWIPSEPTLNAFKTVLYAGGKASSLNFLTYFKNSIIVCSATVLICIFLATFSGYGFSRLQMRRKRTLLTGLMICQMFPLPMLLISFYMMFRRLGLLNSYGGLMLSYTSFALPFCIWMLKGFFDRIPRELEEAALIDGCSRIKALFKVVLPLARPGVVAVGVFSFLVAWDEYIFALTLIAKDSMRTLPPGIVLSFVGQFAIRWEDMMAASVIVTLPVVLTFLFLQRQLIKGLTAGAVKG